MLLYPKAYFNNVREISYEFLYENNIKALVLDVDNTLIDYDRNLSEENIVWANELKKKGIKFYILSNTNKKEKVEAVSKKMDIPYINFAKKPFKGGFEKVKRLLEEDYGKIAVIGDQIFTDVLGANRCKMFAILVEPIDKKDIILTRVKRPIEQLIKKKYFKSIGR